MDHGFGILCIVNGECGVLVELARPHMARGCLINFGRQLLLPILLVSVFADRGFCILGDNKRISSGGHRDRDNFDDRRKKC